MRLRVSDHTVKRFMRHWRRGMDAAEARATLEALVARSAATKRRTLPADACVHVGLTRDASVVRVTRIDELDPTFRAHVRGSRCAK